MARGRRAPTPRATVVALAVTTSLALLGDLMLYTALPVHHEAAGIPVGALGVILSVHRFIRLAANPVGGLVYDRLGRRRPFLAGLGLATLASLGYLLARSFWPLLAARLVWGLAFSLISVGALSILLDVTTPADRARTVGGFHALANVGRVLVFLASGWLVAALGYRRTLAVFVPLTAVGVAVAWAALGETRPAAVGEAPARLLASLRALDRRLLVPAAAGFATFFGGNGVLMATLGLHLREEAAGPGTLVPLAALTGVLLGARQAVAIVAAPVAGRIADALGDRAAVAAVGATIGVAGFATLTAGRGLGAVVAGVVLVALGESVLGPALTAWAGDLTAPALRGAAMGGLAAANDLGGATGPLVGIALASTAGLRVAYALAALFALAALALILLGRRAGGGRTGAARS